MPQFLRRSVIDFGKIDAKSAMVARDIEARKLFLNSFVLPKDIDMAAIFAGDKYLFYGAKGSGKTALLRYTMEEERKVGNVTKFIIFSEDITQQEKNQIADGVNIVTVEKPDIEELIDVRDMWKIFLIKNICDLLCQEQRLFDEQKKTKRIQEMIESVLDLRGTNFLDKTSKKIKSGTLRVKAQIREFIEVESIINFENDDGTLEINYGRFADLVVKSICNILYPEDVRYCLFIDELNLSMIQHKQHRKDSILIRDLIRSIGILNRVFTENKVPIFLYAAVRIEVAKAINISRNEIDKYLVDHGQKMQWIRGTDLENYPIFEVIEQRIVALESKLAGKSNKMNEVWSEYFPREIYGVSPKKFLSEVTWCNPRDIVTIFNLAALSEATHPLYDTAVFSGVAYDYSELVWSERAEELNSEYSMGVVNEIKRLLSQYYKYFKLEEFTKQAENKALNNGTLRQAISTVGMEKICKDLYHVGVLGQSVAVYQGRRKATEKSHHDIIETWFYRDNREFDSSQWFVVHRGLYPCLKLGSWRADLFERGRQTSD